MLRINTIYRKMFSHCPNYSVGVRCGSFKQRETLLVINALQCARTLLICVASELLQVPKHRSNQIHKFLHLSDNHSDSGTLNADSGAVDSEHHCRLPDSLLYTLFMVSHVYLINLERAIFPCFSSIVFAIYSDHQSIEHSTVHIRPGFSSFALLSQSTAWWCRMSILFQQ